MARNGQGDDGSGAEKGDIARLIAALGGRDHRKRSRARSRLVALGTLATPQLQACLSAPRRMVRWEAAKTLEEIADPAAAGTLVLALEDKDVDVRWLAGEGLIALGIRAVQPLMKALLDRPDSQWLLEGAHHVCHGLADRKDLQFVRQVAEAITQQEPEIAVPAAAYAVLNKLETLA